MKDCISTYSMIDFLKKDELRVKNLINKNRGALDKNEVLNKKVKFCYMVSIQSFKSIYKKCIDEILENRNLFESKNLYPVFCIDLKIDVNTDRDCGIHGGTAVMNASFVKGNLSITPKA